MVSAADRVKNPTRTSVWLEQRTPRNRRSDQPDGLDRDKITAVAVRLLDAEGLAKFSMRRLAAELNVTAMSIYWYVDTKDDLLELALDSVMCELPLRTDAEGSAENGAPAETAVPAVPAETAAPAETAEWRDELRQLATGYRRMLVRHPWVSPLVGEFLNIGPNALAFAIANQRLMRSTGLPQHGQTGALSAVFQFVYGFGTVEGRFTQRSAAAGMSPDAYFHQAMKTVSEQPEFRSVYEDSAKLMEARGGDTVAEMYERDFAFALDLLIAGIEAKRER